MQAINNVDLTLLSPYDGDVVSFGVVTGRGCVLLRGAWREIIPAVSLDVCDEDAVLVEDEQVRSAGERGWVAA